VQQFAGAMLRGATFPLLVVAADGDGLRGASPVKRGERALGAGMSRRPALRDTRSPRWGRARRYSLAGPVSSGWLAQPSSGAWRC